jgi:hypothetical protein
MINHNNNGSLYDLELAGPNSIFMYPVTEEDVISLTSSLKGKPNSGGDDIPENQLNNVYIQLKGPCHTFTICH